MRGLVTTAVAMATAAAVTVKANLSYSYFVVFPSIFSSFFFDQMKHETNVYDVFDVYIHFYSFNFHIHNMILFFHIYNFYPILNFFFASHSFGHFVWFFFFHLNSSMRNSGDGQLNGRRRKVSKFFIKWSNVYIK